jgi:hypothetical protein
MAPKPATSVGPREPAHTDKQFDVALSFATEDREYVEKVAAELYEMGIKVFYDKYERASLWGKDLYEHLVSVYRDKSRYAVIFCSKHYAAKLWTNHERRAAQERALMSRQEYILPARFDATEIPGILATTGYVDLRECTPAALAALIKEKIGPIPRPEYFPRTPDKLYTLLKREYSVPRDEAFPLARAFFDALTLMTPEERWFLANVLECTCPSDLPDSVHIDVDYLGRLVGASRDQIEATFSRLACLGINSSIKKCTHPEDDLCRDSTVLTASFEPLDVGLEGKNGTLVAMSIINVLFGELCPECRRRALDILDLSVLSTKVGFPERGRQADGARPRT